MEDDDGRGDSCRGGGVVEALGVMSGAMAEQGGWRCRCAGGAGAVSRPRACRRTLERLEDGQPAMIAPPAGGA